MLYRCSEVSAFQQQWHTNVGYYTCLESLDMATHASAQGSRLLMGRCVTAGVQTRRTRARRTPDEAPACTAGHAHVREFAGWTGAAKRLGLDIPQLRDGTAHEGARSL